MRFFRNARFLGGVILPLLALGGRASPQGGLRKTTGDSELDRKIDRALEAGTAWLVEMLPHLAGDHLSLALFAALEGGAEKGEPKVKTALDRILSFRSESVYGTGIQLMLFRKYGGPKARRLSGKALRRLLGWQKSEGGWSYGKGRMRCDASNTQYALLGLRAAFEGGEKIPGRVLRKAVDYLLSTKGREGGFSYLKGRKSFPTDSMTAGTLGSLAICREIAGKDGLGEKREKAVERALRQGIWWLERVFPSSLKNAAMGMQRGYFLYALERAMVLLGRERLGAIRWYPHGASWLVARQDRDGSWGEDVAATSFAVLFLARSFRPITPVTRVSPEEMLLRLKRSPGEKGVLSLAARLAGAGKAAVPACLKALRGPSPARRRAAALALERITGIRTSFDPGKEPTWKANQDAARLWEKWWMEHR